MARATGSGAKQSGDESVRNMLVALAAATALVPATAFAQGPVVAQTIAGTKLDITATGEVTRCNRSRLAAAFQ